MPKWIVTFRYQWIMFFACLMSINKSSLLTLAFTLHLASCKKCQTLPWKIVGPGDVKPFSTVHWTDNVVQVVTVVTVGNHALVRCRVFTPRFLRERYADTVVLVSFFKCRSLPVRGHSYFIQLLFLGMLKSVFVCWTSKQHHMFSAVSYMLLLPSKSCLIYVCASVVCN